MTRDPSASAGFTDRVMADIAGEATPTTARSFVSALRRRSARDAAAVLWVAWHLGTVRRWRIATGVRARSIALVLAVICALATGSLAAASALRVAVEPVGVLLRSGADDHGAGEDDPAAAAPPRPVADDRSGHERLQDDQDADVDEEAEQVPSIDGPTIDEARGDIPSGEDENTDADQPEPGQLADDESLQHDEPNDAVDADDEPGDDDPGADDDPDADDDPSGTDEPDRDDDLGTDDDRETDESGENETSASDEGEDEERQPGD